MSGLLYNRVNKKSLWRPKGWVNPYQQSDYKVATEDITPIQKRAFEVGADALLEALRDMGANCLHSIDANNDIGFRLVKGKKVFIPDEEGLNKWIRIGTGFII